MTRFTDADAHRDALEDALADSNHLVQRVRLCMAWRSIAGTDWATAHTPNPWPAIDTLVTREAPGGGGDPVVPRERIQFKEAIVLYTTAYRRQPTERAR